MNITEYYTLEATPDYRRFSFQSIGQKGVFDLTVFFDRSGINRFNLALCVVENGMYRDDVTTDNGDFVKIISTTIKALEDFFEFYPHVIVEIGASDEQRLRVYNGIIRRRFFEIEPRYIVHGLKDGQFEPYHPNESYELFEIQARTH